MIFETLSQVSTLTELGGLRVAWEFLQKGGIFMVPLVLTSIAGMMAILYKALSLSNKRVIPATLVREMIQYQPRIITGCSIAPLLGLLGTASGLVRIFEGLGDNSDHLAIARGISEALTTTIVGLAIAVPCVVAHGYFIRRIETLTARLESVLSAFTSICEKPHSNS